MVLAMKNTEELCKEVNIAWDKYQLGTFAQAERKTGIERTMLHRMRKYGIPPSANNVIKWANSINEPANKWLGLAGYETATENLVCETKPTYQTMRDILANVPGITPEGIEEAIHKYEEERAAE